MRSVLGSTYMMVWAYNLIGSNWSDTSCKPVDLGTQVWFRFGTQSGTIKPTIATRTDSMYVRSTLFISSTMWSKMTVQSQHRANTIDHDKYAALVYVDPFVYSGSVYSLAVIGSIDAPDLDSQFRSQYFWGINGSNFYTKFAGFSACAVVDTRYSGTVAIWGTLDSKTLPVNGTLATLIFRGTNTSPYPISPRRIALFGSWTGTSGATGTVLVLTKSACDRQYGHMKLLGGSWEDVGSGTVWIGTFYVSPFFGTYRYYQRDELATIVVES